jgi:sugar phosphate isomerase/epimerase
MTRSIILFSGQWTDLRLEELAPEVSSWGYQGLELCCWGDHFEIPAALEQESYCQAKLDLLARHDLVVPVLATHRTGQAVCDRIEPRHQAVLSRHVWGAGEPEKIQKRAAEEIKGAARAAQKMGVPVVSGFTGSSLWPAVLGYPAPTPALVEQGFQDFKAKWEPILDVYAECGVRYALEVHPGQIAFDLYSAEMALDALGGREEFGFTFDPSHLFWQGIDPSEFVRRFPDRIFHVHIKDIALSLNGRNSLLGSCLPYGDARRGWDFRAPGRGGLDWESIIRALNHVGYEGPLSVEWGDRAVSREQAAEEAVVFLKRLDFQRAGTNTHQAFRAEE